MKKFKLSKRTKSIGLTTALFASATAINIIKDQATEIGALGNKVQNLYDKAFDSLNYELNLESFIVNNFGEDVLQTFI